MGDTGEAGDPSDTGDDSDSDSSSTDTGDPTDPDPGGIDGDGCTAALDVLVVVDNSGSMSSLQRRLTDGFPTLLHGLDQAGVDWRLAITTTDNGNVWCPPETTTPELGRFVFSPCTSRLGDFLFGVDVDAQAMGCLDICNVDPAELEASPTYTDQDGQLKPRPWLQREGGQLNVAADVDDAIRCLLPQGVNGCGFEQPLESMRRGLARTTQAGVPEAGFLREDASLLIVIVTDEADCSAVPEFDQIFDADGDKVFWHDPQDAFPTSALCWNAGVQCTGGPGQDYGDCVAANKGLDGEPGPAAEAVMYPVNRYQTVLTAIEAHKRAVSGDAGLDVAMLAITGVGLDGSLVYSDVGDTDPVFQATFGIGPGCSTPNELDPATPIQAVPPVRVREVANHVSSNALASICAPSFEPYMLDLLDRFVGDC